MLLDPLSLPTPCRSGMLCQTCRDPSAGESFRRSQGALHPAMFREDFACAFDLPWNHKGPAPWGEDFRRRIREQLHEAAADQIAHQSRLGPGDVVKLALAKLGYRAGPNCGCDEFRDLMNSWGWRGCLRRRREIIAWFASKAREQNIRVTDDSVWSLIRAGLKDLLARRKS